MLRIRMAITALHLVRRMCAAQRKMSFIVVKPAAGVFPVLCAVTGLALGAQRIFMLVVFFMAGHAVHGCALESWAGVAAVAFDLVVLTQQRKARLAMIEARWIFPTQLTVA